MRWSIHAIAAGAAMICFAPLSLAASDAADKVVASAPAIEQRATPVVEPVSASAPQFLPPEPTDSQRGFVWAEDFALTPPIPLSGVDDSPFALPNGSPAIPLPSAVWTGFTALAWLGGASLLRRMRRA